MSSNTDSFWVVTAPSRNWENIPTIDVCNHEVPLPAYWKIVDLLMQEKSRKDIIQSVISHTGFKTLQVVTDVVESVAENQRLMSRRSTLTNRLSVPFKKAHRISAYRVGRKEKTHDVEAEESALGAAEQREKRLLQDALAISYQKEQLKGKEMSAEERRRTASAIDHEMKHVLKLHQEAETEIKHARRITTTNKALPV